MRAYLTLNDEHKPIQTGPLQGVIPPYLTKHGGIVPLFTFDSDDMHIDTTKEIEAQPGMIGMSMRDEMFMVLSDKTAVPLPAHILTPRQYERYVRLEQSQKAEVL